MGRFPTLRSRTPQLVEKLGRRGCEHGHLLLVSTKSSRGLLTPPMRLEFNGYRWRLGRDMDAAALRPALERFPEFQDVSGARVLKHNRLRSVWHLPPDGDCPEMIAKVYRYEPGLSSLRYRLWRSRSEQEWYALERFRALELPAPRAIGVAALSAGAHRGGGLLLEYLPATRPLNDVVHVGDRKRPPGLVVRDPFERDGDLTGAQEVWLQVTGHWIRQLHERGVWHRDLHSGNLLVDEDARRFYFIDLHSCRFLPRLGMWQRQQGVLALLHSLSGSIPRRGLRIFAEAYGPEALVGTSGSDEDKLREFEALVTRGLIKSRKRRIRSRSKRCFLRSTMFDISRRGGDRVYHLREYTAPELASLWTSKPPGRVLKESRTGWVVEAECQGRQVCVKRLSYSWSESIRALFESHRLRRAYAAGHSLWVRGIASPHVIALHERRTLGLVREAHLVTEFVPHALPLDRHLKAEYWGRVKLTPDAARWKHEFARHVGEFVRRIHDEELFPHDLSPQNILVMEDALRAHRERAEAAGESPGDPVSDDEPRFLCLVDLDHLYLWQSLPRRGRLKNLVQVGNLPEGHVSTTDRLRGLKAYAKGADEWWNSELIGELRKRALDEHFRVLLNMTRKSGKV